MKILKLLLVFVLLVGCSKPQDKIAKTKKEEKQDPTVSFVAVGDNVMHERLLIDAKTSNSYDFKPYYENIKPYIQEADLAFINQETVLGGSASGFPEFSTPDEMARDLQDVGFDIINGATNHALDKGKNGLLHSIQVFSKYPNLTYIGLYESQEKRNHIEIVEKNGIKIAFLSYNQYTNNHMMPNSYCMNLFNEDVIKKDVKKAKGMSDFVIVSCHWGNEYSTKPDSFQKKYAQLFADLGADVILGTHTHTLEPVEWIEGKNGHKTLVAYSLGNFIHGMLEEETQLGGMLSFDLKKKDNECSIENIVLTPVMNHYTASNLKDVYNTRENFTVYRLKDYNEKLASEHALNYYKNRSIQYSKMQEIVKQRIKGIDVDM